MDDIAKKVVALKVQGKSAREIINETGLSRFQVRMILAENGHGKDPRSNNKGKPKDKSEAVDVADSEEAPGYSYEFRSTTGDYIFTFPGRAGALVLSRERVRQMKIDYTNWSGEPHNMEQVALANGITTNEFFGIKRAMGWRKTSLPMLDEDMADLSETEIADRLFQMKKRGAEIQANRRVWRDIETAAKKWADFESKTLDPFFVAAERTIRHHEPPVVSGPKSPVEPFALVFSPTDLHYGKYHWARYGGGPKFDRERCRARLMQATERMFDRLAATPEVIISTIGSDWFNADNIHGSTSSGRHVQDNDGTPEQIWEEGMTLAIDVHEIIAAKSGGEVWIVLQRGNHDDLLSGALYSVLHAWFRNDPRFKFHDGRGPYNYVKYGESMLMVTHGDGTHRARELANIMAHERPQMWGSTKWKYALTGNLHHHAVHEEGGVVCFLLPSLSGSDRYHTRQGYMLARPGLMGLRFDRETGFAGTVFGHVDDDLIPQPVVGSFEGR